MSSLKNLLRCRKWLNRFEEEVDAYPLFISDDGAKEVDAWLGKNCSLFLSGKLEKKESTNQMCAFELDGS